MECRVFRQRLAQQMLKYAPVNNLYAVDKKLREYMSANKDKRAKAVRRRPRGSPFPFRLACGKVLSYHSLHSVHRTLKSGRFCCNLTDYEKHLELVNYKNKNTRKCYVCGEQTLFSCNSCVEGSKSPALCWDTRRAKDEVGNIIRKYCFSIYHNPHYFGLCRADFKALHRTNDIHWQLWTEGTLDDNRIYMNHIMEGLADIIDIDNDDEETQSTTPSTTTPSAIG